MRDIFVNQDEHSSWRMCTAVPRTRDHSQASFGALGVTQANGPTPGLQGVKP